MRRAAVIRAKTEPITYNLYLILAMSIPADLSNDYSDMWYQNHILMSVMSYQLSYQVYIT